MTNPICGRQRGSRRVAMLTANTVLALMAAVLFASNWARALYAQESTAPGKIIVFRHVTVIDTNGGPARPDMSVVIEGDRILHVGKAREVKFPYRSEVVDASGKFLIPGLWDMHVHTFFGEWVPGGREVTLPLFIATGITGVRDMGSDLDAILAARKDFEQGKLLGPRLVVAGPMLDGPKTQFPASIAVSTQEDGRRTVNMLKSRGVDFIKIQSYVPRDAYFAIADECKKQHITFAGHVPDAIRASEASDAGQKSFEHLIGIFEGSSTVEDELLKGPKGPGRFLETYDDAREQALIRLLAKNLTWQCPTLYWERGQWLVNDPAVVDEVKNDPEAKYAPLFWREKSWPKFTASIIKDLDTDPLEVRQKFVLHELDIVRNLRKAGVPFLAGTDGPAGVDVIPGFSLHRELERFVAAGFTPLQALQTATINPAKFLDELKDFGTVEPGKIADLVLIDANPLIDIRNTRKITAVVSNGRYFSRAQLNEILHDVEKYSAAH
jgi:imidazolonepropionase-like amidohydrolase